MEIKQEEVRKLILDEDDFGFELRVGNAVAKLGQKCRGDVFNGTNIQLIGHGGTYTDPVTNKPRQFDYRYKVYWREPVSGFTSCALLAIECKNLHESAPLVVCGRDRTADEACFAFIRSQYDPAVTLSSVRLKRSNSRDLFYPDSAFVGKSLVRLKEVEESNKKGEPKKKVLAVDNNQNSDVFDRWSQALASCSELAERACFSANEHCHIFCSMILPIVVVPDNSLWKVKYNNAGEIEEEPARVNECEFFVERKVQITAGKFVITHIHFVTLSGLSDLITRFWSHHDVWTWLFPAQAERIT